MHESKQSSAQNMIAALWQRNQPQVLERLALLDQVATEPLTPQLRQDAIATAHKLAGSLGMFGFHEGTRLAREIELLLESPAVDTGAVRPLAAQLRESLFPSNKIIA